MASKKEMAAQISKLQLQVHQLTRTIAQLRENNATLASFNTLRVASGPVPNPSTSRAPPKSTTKPIESTTPASNQAATQPQTDYETDEEEFDPNARGASWMIADGKRRPSKKRKAESSPDISPNGKNEKTSTKENQNQTQPRTFPPPPIYLQNQNGEDNLLKELTKFIKENNFKLSIKTMYQAGHFKLNPKNEEEYRATSQWLNENQVEWYSFSNKQTRPIRVMIRGLHKSTSPEDIVQNLKAGGLQATDAVNILHPKTKKRLNLFMVTFNHNQNIKDVFEIKCIEHQLVKVEEIRARPEIVQCKRCQEYNHTQAFCHRKPACVKCGGTHLTKDCIKLKEEAPKCVNCGGDHPANYRGCIYAERKQQARRAQQRKDNTPSSTNLKKYKPVRPNLTFAELLKAPHAERNQQNECEKPDRPPNQANQANVLEQILAFIEEQRKINESIRRELLM